MESDKEHYWEGCGRGVLLVQRCPRCERTQFPPAARCRRCLADDLTWIASAGGGTVEASSTAHRAPTPAFAAHAPYTVAVVRLDEGPLVETWLPDDALMSLRQEVPVGSRPVLVFRELDGATVPISVVKDTGVARASTS